MNKDLVKFIAKHYLDSGDFNGFAVRDLIEVGLNEKVLRNLLGELVKSDQITLLFEDSHNPYIKAFPPDSIEKQVEKILKDDLTHTCAYPTPSYLASFVNPDDYKNTPFTLRLVLGEPQLSYLSFDLSVLESYRNDPRYYYWNNDISGRIYTHSDIANSRGMSKSDKVFLQTFGFSYDNNMNRAVAVFLIYLHKLSPEHQQIWNSKLLEGEYKLHPDYYRASIKGNFPEGISVFSAFSKELKVINEMAKLMSKEPLFNTILENWINKYFKDQRVLITKAHHAIRILRQILGCHPATKDYELPRYLKSSKIWTY